MLFFAFYSCKKSETGPVLININPPLENRPGQTYTLAGKIQGFSDGLRLNACLNNPNEIAVDKAGNLFVVDQANNVIRKITTDGSVSTFADSGIAGHADGKGTGASFNDPIGIAIDAANNILLPTLEITLSGKSSRWV